MTPDELAAVMHRGAQQTGRRVLRALLLEGFLAADELAALWLIAVEGYDQPIGEEILGTPDWQMAMAEVQTAKDDIEE